MQGHDFGNLLRRRHKRLALDTGGGFLFKGDYYMARVVSLSEGGMRIRSGLPLKRGDIIKPQFHLGDDMIFLKARVLYQLPQDDETGEVSIGMEFVDLRESDLLAIRAYVKVN